MLLYLFLFKQGRNYTMPWYQYPFSRTWQYLLFMYFLFLFLTYYCALSVCHNTLWPRLLCASSPHCVTALWSLYMDLDITGLTIPVQRYPCLLSLKWEVAVCNIWAVISLTTIYVVGYHCVNYQDSVLLSAICNDIIVCILKNVP